MKPILFNTEMVRAILSGRKTQTRRVVKFPEGMTGRLPPSGANDYLYYPCGIKYPQYQKGDILWVRETWCRHGNPDAGRPMHYDYRADREDTERDDAGFIAIWRPSIHMPREAARIFLRVTDVRVERLRDITESDAVAEGVERGYITTARENFADVWNSTIKPADRDRYGWAANPWVWVYTFKRCGKEDESWN